MEKTMIRNFNLVLVLVLFSIILTLNGCSRITTTITKTPQDKEYLYVEGLSDWLDSQKTSRNIAETDARQRFANEMEAWVETGAKDWVKAMDERTRGIYEQIVKTTASALVKELRSYETKVDTRRKKGVDLTKTMVTLRQSKSEAALALKDKIMNEEELRRTFEASQFEGWLDNQTNRLEEFKQQQKP